MNNSIKNRLYIITLMGLIIGIGSLNISHKEPLEDREIRVNQAADSKWVEFTPTPTFGLRYKFEYTFTDGLNLNFIRWDFGDGTPEIEDNYDNPYHYTFPSPGDYEVKLTVRFTGDSEEYQKKYTITVEELQGIEFEIYQSQEYEYYFQYNIPYTGNIENFKWDFGDGAIVEMDTVNPIYHTYAEDGKYIIILSVKFEGDPLFHTVTHELEIGDTFSIGGNDVPDPLSFIPGYPIGLLSLILVLGGLLAFKKTAKLE